jgi:Pyridoxamine 5'-phosphate oxidase
VRRGRAREPGWSYYRSAMNLTGVLEFLRSQRYAVQASVSPTGGPQAALIGYAVTERLEMVFDTLASTRKAGNLRRKSSIAMVVGNGVGDERTVQYEGEAEEVAASDEAVRRAYYAVWPDGPERANWPGLIYFRVRPRWIRYSDFDPRPPLVVEFGEEELAGFRG